MVSYWEKEGEYLERGFRLDRPGWPSTSGRTGSEESALDPVALELVMLTRVVAKPPSAL